MSGNLERIRVYCIYFVSLISVGYCLYTHALYPPSAFFDRGVYLGSAFILFFLIRAPKCKNKWNSLAFLLATIGGAAVSCYMIIEEQRISDNFYRANESDFYLLLLYIASSSIVISQMAGGKIVAGLSLLGSLYIFGGHYIPGLFGHPHFSNIQATIMLLTDVDKGAFGDLVGLLARLLSIFLIFAALLLASGLGDLINAVAAGLLGRLKGGPAKIAVISSMFFGMLSGSPVANVAATGSVTIPLMKRLGYDSKAAGAIESIASTGGELMPPVMGLGAFVMSEVLGISYLTICLWGIVPAILWYWTVYWIVHFRAFKDDVKIWSPPRSELIQTLKEKFHLSLALLAFLVFIIKTEIPETAVFWSVVFLIFVAIIRKETRLTGSRLAQFLEQYAETISSITLLLSLLGIFVSAVTSTGFHIKLGMLLLGGMHNWFFVAIVVFVLCIVFGMAVPVIAAYLAVVLIAAPVMVELGISNSLVHMFVFYASCLAPITPPVAMAAFTASSISGADPMKTAATATTMGLPLWIIPFLLLKYGFYLGMEMPVYKVALWTVLSMASCYIFVIGSVGWCFKRKLKNVERVVAVTLGVLGLQPFSCAVSIMAVAAGIAFVSILFMKTKGVRLFAAN